MSLRGDLKRVIEQAEEQKANAQRESSSDQNEDIDLATRRESGIGNGQWSKISIVLAFILIAICVTYFSTGLLLKIGIWGAVAVVLFLNRYIGQAYKYQRKPHGPVRPGEMVCPSCGSLQTDQIRDFDSTGSEYLIWNCFNCDHRWGRIQE